MKKIKSFDGCSYKYLGYENGMHFIDNGNGVEVYTANGGLVGVSNMLKYKNTALEFAYTLNTDEIINLNKRGVLVHG